MGYRLKVRHGVFAATACLLLLAGVNDALPQYQSSGSATPAAIASDAPGDIAAYFDCVGWTATDDPNYSLALTTVLYWGSEFLRAYTEWGLMSLLTSVRGDITIGKETGKLAECHWTASWGGYWTDALWYPAREAHDIRVVNDQFWFGDVGNYLRYRVYEVWDNYDRRFRYSGTPVYEHLTPINNGCRLGWVTAEAALNSEAQFGDSYHTQGQLPVCLQDPNCVSTFQQLHQVGSSVFEREVAYGCYGVTVTP